MFFSLNFFKMELETIVCFFKIDADIGEESLLRMYV